MEITYSVARMIQEIAICRCCLSKVVFENLVTGLGMCPTSFPILERCLHIQFMYSYVHKSLQYICDPLWINHPFAAFC